MSTISPQKQALIKMNRSSNSNSFSISGINDDSLINTVIVCSDRHSPNGGNALHSMIVPKLNVEAAASMSRKRSRNRFHMNWKIPGPSGKEDSQDHAADKPPKTKPKTTTAANTTGRLIMGNTRKAEAPVSPVATFSDDTSFTTMSPRRSRNRALSEEEFEHKIFPTLVFPSLLHE